MENKNRPFPAPDPQAVIVSRPTKASLAPSHYVVANPYHALEQPDDSDEGGGFLDYWRIIVRHRRTIILSSLAGLVLGFAIGIPLKPVYRAKTSIEVLTLNQDFMNMKQANPTSNESSFDTSEAATQAKLLTGEALSKRVILRLNDGKPILNTQSAFQTTDPADWRRWLHLPEKTVHTPRENLLLAAVDSVKVKETPHTRVLEISVDSTDPKLASDYANTLTQEFIAQSSDARWAATRSTGEWLHRELDDARDKLRRSEDALQAYARESGIILTDDTTNVATEKLQQVQQELSTASADRIAKQSRYELAQKSAPDSLADVLSDAALRETQSKINELNRQIADLSAVFNPEYSKIRRLQAELDASQSAFNRQRAEILSRIKTDFEEAVRKERLLADAYSSQTQEVTGQGEKTIQYNILKREVDSNRQLYDTMLQQTKQSSVAAALRSSNVRIVDPAELPTMPVFPNFKINAAVGMLAGLFLSSFIVILRDEVDRTLHQPGDIKQWVDLPELGAIPNASIERPRSNPTKLRLGDADGLPEALELVTWQRKPSFMAEAFRSVLTSILFAGDSGRPLQVLVITSMHAGDGKTTVVSNLAIAAAEIRLKVLIIDADLRRPRMHQLFNIPNDRGLTDLLHRDLDLHTAPPLIQRSGIVGLDILPSGPATHAASHLLHSPNLQALLYGLRDQYDMILIDTPPVMQMTDARIVGRQADAVVLVARATHTSRDVLLTAKERFAEDRIPVLGSVLNNWDPKRAAKEYSPQYHQYNK